MMTTGDPHTIAFKQQMDALNDFIADMDIPHELGVAARAYLRNTRELRKKLSYDQLVARLSPGLQGTIMLHMSQSTFSKVWYLHGVEPECLVQLAGRLRRIGYPPKEKIPSTCLSIVMRGIVARGGDLMYQGSTWGEDMILTSTVLRDTRFATALTYVEVFALHRDDLFNVLAAYPGSKKEVQNAAMRMAIKRTVILLKAYADSQRVKQSEASAAYAMLTSAFGQPPATPKGGEEPNDLGRIFRTITGQRLRDVDSDGNLVEQVLPQSPQPGARASVSFPMGNIAAEQLGEQLSEGKEERAELQKGAQAIQKDVAQLQRTVGGLAAQVGDMHAMLIELTRHARTARGAPHVDLQEMHAAGVSPLG